MRDYAYYLNHAGEKALAKKRISQQKDLDWWIEAGLRFLGERLNLLALLGVLFLLFKMVSTFVDVRFFPLRSVEIEGALLTEQSDIAVALASTQQQAFFALDPEVVQAQLASLPWIKEVRVDKIPFGKLRIQLKEYAPVYRFGEQGLLDVEGRLFAKSPNKFAYLPKIVADSSKRQQALKAYETYKNWFEFSDDLQMEAFVLSSGLSWEVQLKNGAQIKFGREALEDRVKRFNSAYQTGNLPDFTQVEIVDFRYHYGFAVKWREEYLEQQNFTNDMLGVTRPAALKL